MIVLSVALLIYGYLYINSVLQLQETREHRGATWHNGAMTTIRLRPDEDLKDSLLSFAKAHKLSAASIVSAVGSLKSLNVRLASAAPSTPSEFLQHKEERFEIVSLVGTMEYNGTSETAYGHFHMSVADKSGAVFGGHLMSGCRIFTTAEITVVNIPELQYGRRFDPQSGYNELVVSEAEGFYTRKLLRTYEKGFGMLLRYLRQQYCLWQASSAGNSAGSCPAVY
jgi:predicted DNA-binding protein with PD1-like motif